MKKIGVKVAAAALILSAVGFFGLVPEKAYADWSNATGEWQYIGRDQTPETERWKESQGQWYYLAADGNILRDRIFQWKSENYFVDSDGRMLRSGWMYVETKHDPDVMFEEGWYYFGADGRGYRRRGKGFRKEIGGKFYAFDDNGKMLTGFLSESGEPLTEEDPFVEALYYAGADGALYTEAWLDYGSIDFERGVGGSDLDSANSGRSYADFESMWLYFDAKSQKVRSTSDKLRQRDIGGVSYAFDENGVMAPWWARSASISDAQRSNPTTLDGVKYFSGYDGGKLFRNSWFWMYPSENLNAEDYDNQESSWWYADTNGEVVKNRIRTINGRKYAFDGIGRMQTGFVLFGADGEFMNTLAARYDTDAYTARDFIFGEILGGQRSHLYYFNPDELNDGSMVTGTDLKIKLGDGEVRTFAFLPSGKAYGSGNRMLVRHNNVYINGLRLDADPEFGYGIVEVKAYVDTDDRDGYTDYYVLVDTNGRIVRGNKRAVKDKNGGYALLLDSKVVAYVAEDAAPIWRKGAAGEGFYYNDKGEKNPYRRGRVTTSIRMPALTGVPSEIRINFN